MFRSYGERTLSRTTASFPQQQVFLDFPTTLEQYFYYLPKLAMKYSFTEINHTFLFATETARHSQCQKTKEGRFSKKKNICLSAKNENDHPTCLR